MATINKTIRYDLTAGDHLSGPMSRAAESMDAAARNARQLDRALASQRKATDVAAGASLALARADDILKEAEHGLRDGALEAEFALKRQAEAEKRAGREAEIAAARQQKLADAFSNVANRAGGFSLKGAGLALTPALIPLAGGVAAGVGAIGASFGAAALGAGLFAKAATSVLSKASSNLQKLQALEVKVNTARTAAQKKAAQQQVTALTSTWDKGYLAMIDALKTFQQKWTEVSQAIAVPALTAGIRALSDGIGFLKPALTPVAAVFTSWGKTIDRYFTSRAGSAEMTRLATAFGKFSASQLRDIGVFITDIGRGVFSLGRDLAGHNIDFGTFGKHLDTWGAAFARWSSSAAARQDVNKFLAYLHDNGPVVSGLLKNLGGDLKLLAPGLTGAGSLELKAVSGFLGFLARTPKFIAQPLTETAGALLLLQKTGVLRVGIKVVGAAAKFLTNGAIDIGGGAAAGAEIRAAFASGGAAAAAEIRAAMAGGGAAAGAEGAAGAAAGSKGRGIPGIVGGTGAWAAAGTLAAGVFAGAMIRALGDKLSPAGSFAGNLNHNLQRLGTPASTSLLHSFTFGGLESWMTAKFGIPVGKVINDTLGSLGRHGKATTAAVGGNFSQMSDTILGAMRRAGQATDSFRTKNLLPVLGAAGRVSGGIQGLQHQISILHGKTVSIGAHLSGSGGVQVTPSSGAPGAKNYSVFFKPLARGGRLPGFGGGDRIPILAEAGEAVVDKHRARRYAPVLKAMGVPGFAAGGLVGNLAADTGHDVAAEARASLAPIVSSIRKRLAALNPFAGITGVPSGGKISGSAQAFAKSILWAYGWGANQFPSLQALWNGESGWRWNALNPSSGAYGIPQSLPASKMAAAGPDWRTNPATQIRWGLGYIKSAYGSPASAYSRWLGRSPHWYDQGGIFPARSIGINGTSGPEVVLTKRQWTDLHDLLVASARRHEPPWLARLMQAHTRLLASLERAQHKAAANTAAAKAYAGQQAQSLTGYAGLSGVIGTTAPPQVSAGQIVAGLQQKLRNLRNFGAAIRRLSAKGLSRALLRQIIDMGPDDGLSYARAILDSPGVIRPLNTAEAGIGRAAAATGRTQADALYGTRGGNTYHITVNVPHTASKAAVGREIVELIREYERGSGSGWRKR